MGVSHLLCRSALVDAKWYHYHYYYRQQVHRTLTDLFLRSGSRVN